jgi:hypothetical protein
MAFWMATDWASFFERKSPAKGEYRYIEWLKADITRGSMSIEPGIVQNGEKSAELANLQEDQSQFILSRRPESAMKNHDTLKTDPKIEKIRDGQGQTQDQDQMFWKALLLGRSAAATNL